MLIVVVATISHSTTEGFASLFVGALVWQRDYDGDGVII